MGPGQYPGTAGEEGRAIQERDGSDEQSGCSCSNRCSAAFPQGNARETGGKIAPESGDKELCAGVVDVRVVGRVHELGRCAQGR